MGNLSWASPKSSKSTSTSTSNDRGRYRTYSAPMPKKAKPKAKVKAKVKTPKINYGSNRNQRANLPSEVYKPVRLATPVRSTAKTTPVASAKITQGGEDRPSGSLKSGLITKAIAAPVANVIKPIAQSKTSQDPKLLREMGVAKKGSKSSLLSINPIEDASKIKTTMGKVTDGYGVNAAVTAGSAYKNQPKATGAQEFADPTERAKFMLKEYQNTPTEDRQGFNESSYDKKAVSSKDSIMPTVSDKYRNNEVSYNQAYWKAKLDGKTSQADMAAEQKALGSKKIYSGDRAITEQDQSVAKQIELYLKDSGIKPTVENMKKGFFGETMLTNSSYDIGTGKNILTSKETTSPTILGFRFGDDITKSSVNGVNTYVKTGQGDTQKTESAKLSASNDRVEAGPDPVAEMKDIDNQIKNETDPVKLKALYQRRLRLMRMNRTNTRFAGLLGEPDTKRTNLMSIS